LISKEQAEASGLELHGKVRVGGTGEGKEEGALVRGATLNLSGVDLFPEATLALPQEFFHTLATSGGRTMNGIFGYDLFSRFVVEIDYARQIINLYEPKRYRYSGAGEVIPIELKGKKPYVNAAVMPLKGSPIQSNVHIDTGSSGALSLYKLFVDANKLLESAEKTVDTWPRGAGGETRAPVGRVKSLQLGRFMIDNPTTSFSLTQGKARTDSAGRIGGELLRRFKVILDYSRQQMVLEPNTHFAEAYEHDMSGAQLLADGPDLKVFRVYKVIKDSPATEAGLREGDIVLAVDGKPATELTLEQVRQVFKQEAQERVLRVRRGERSLELRIKLSRLI
jgi:hypothetical protein